MPDKDRRLHLLGLAGNGDADLRSLVERQGILLGKLLGEVGSGNILYGIESPDTDVTVHATSSSAHHAKYLDSAAISAVPFVQYIPFGSEPITGQSYAP